MPPIKVLVDLTAYSPSYRGGVTTYVNGLIPALNRNAKLEVHLLLCGENKTDHEEQFPGIQTIYIRPRLEVICKLIDRANFNLFQSRRLLSISQKLRWGKSVSEININFSVVYVPTTYINFRIKNSVYVTSLHDIQERSLPENFTRKQINFRDVNVRNTLKNSDVIQVSSEFVKKEIKKYYKKASLNIYFRVIFEGVNLEIFNNSDLNRKLPHVYLCPASYHPHKNHDFLSKSLQSYEGSTPIEIRYCGNGIERIKEVLKSSNEKVKANILGTITLDELRSEFRYSSYVVLPTLYESSSLPLLEAVAMNCLVLASDIPAHLEQLKHLDFFIFNPQDSAALLETIRRVESLSETERISIVRGNNQKIKQFSWEHVATEYSNCFEEFSLKKFQLSPKKS